MDIMTKFNGTIVIKITVIMVSLNLATKAIGPNLSSPDKM